MLFSIYINAICISPCQLDKNVYIIDVDIKQYVSCCTVFVSLVFLMYEGDKSQKINTVAVGNYLLVLHFWL